MRAGEVLIIRFHLKDKNPHAVEEIILVEDIFAKKLPLQLTTTYVLPLLFLQENLNQVLAGRVRVHLVSRLEARHMTRCNKTRIAEKIPGYDIDSLISTRRVICVKVQVTNWSLGGRFSKYD